MTGSHMSGHKQLAVSPPHTLAFLVPHAVVVTCANPCALCVRCYVYVVSVCVCAAPGIKYVPVPPVTGFAGVWEIIPERTDPHPQPIVSLSWLLLRALFSLLLARMCAGVSRRQVAAASILHTVVVVPRSRGQQGQADSHAACCVQQWALD